MGSTTGERPVASGLIPQWMKTKINETRLDLEESAAFSPPTLDDSFFYIRYPRDSSTAMTSDKMLDSKDVNGKKVDYTRHTPSCQQVLVNPDITSTKIKTGTVRVKSNGTDDGFKGEGAACGTSILQVASQMVSGSSITRGFFSSNSEPTSESSADSPPQGWNSVARRGSRSLPASPLTTPVSSPNSSPKVKRRHQNRYFTGAFVDSDNTYQGSWILSGLLGKRENVMSQSASTILEDESENTKVTHSVPVHNVSMEGPEGNGKQKSHVFRPKPSELREMNFWSPTSM